MTFEELSVGSKIKNKEQFEGEGAYIVIDLSSTVLPGHIYVEAFGCEKYPGLNGQRSYIDIDSLEHFEPIPSSKS